MHVDSVIYLVNNSVITRISAAALSCICAVCDALDKQNNTMIITVSNLMFVNNQQHVFLFVAVKVTKR